MKTKLSTPWLPIIGLLLLSCSTTKLNAQGTLFTYQGQLIDNGSPASGSYDFRVRLASDALGNNFVAGPLFSNAVPVNGGLFVLRLDFGAGVFTGSNYWLQVDVKATNAGGYTTLTPLQALTAAPYAITAGNLSGSLPATQISGTIPPTQLPASVVTNNATGLTLAGSFTGSGANLTSVDAATLGGISSAGFWKTNGNAGANPTNGAFLGTTDNLPLDIKVNGQRAFRIASAIDPTYGTSPNLVGGFAGNIISNGVAGGVISGGGAAAAPNRVGNQFATVVGGFGNIASGFAATAMGNLATASGGAATAIGSSSLASGGAATAMGQNTTASGGASTAMGYGSSAGGTYSTAMGRRANASQDGTFVWGDSQNADFTSTATDQFLLRAAGGVGINTNNPGATLDVNGSLRVGFGTTVFRNLQGGVAQMANTSSTAKTNFTFQFPRTFGTVPNVIVTARNEPAQANADDTFAVSVRRVTTTNCTVNVVRVDTAAGWGQLLLFDWIAWE